MRLCVLVGMLQAVLFLVIGVAEAAPTPTTPIEHVVIIFQENQSFDHYFATYPSAANKPANRDSGPPRGLRRLTD
jgi:phospholipase C